VTTTRRHLPTPKFILPGMRCQPWLWWTRDSWWAPPMQGCSAVLVTWSRLSTGFSCSDWLLFSAPPTALLPSSYSYNARSASFSDGIFLSFPFR